ncbi:MAG: hypothetical protein JNL01_04150 [Bdellovibrionales bacterium]|nr:hypothetical protein [Bdellovibrionales bacterium]
MASKDVTGILQMIIQRLTAIVLGFWINLAPAQAWDHWTVISDSHGVGAFGGRISQWLRSRTDTSFYFLASGGSHPAHWLKETFTSPCAFDDSDSMDPKRKRVCLKILTPTLDGLLQARPKFDRSITLIIQGTNFSLDPKQRKTHVQQTEDLAKIAAASSDLCFWVGPPNMTKSPGYDAAAVVEKFGILQDGLKNIPGCQLIDSRLISTYPASGGDGVHYHWPAAKDPVTIQAAEDWADRLIQELGPRL